MYEVPAGRSAPSSNIATQLSHAFHGRNFSPMWSPDGKIIAYLRTAGRSNSHNTLCLTSVATGEERTFDPGLARSNRMFWSPDSQTIGISGIAEGRHGGWGIYLFSVTAGKVISEHLQTNDHEGWPLGFSADGKAFIFGELKTKERVAVDIKTRAQRRVSSAAEIAWLQKGDWEFDFTTDGARVAYVHNEGATQELVVADAENMRPRVVTRVTRPATIMSPRWSPDHTKTAYYATGLSDNGGTHLRICAADGSWDREVGAGDKFIGNATLPPSWSPDSEKIVLTLVNRTVGEIGVLENFLPPEKLAAK